MEAGNSDKLSQAPPRPSFRKRLVFTCKCGELTAHLFKLPSAYKLRSGSSWGGLRHWTAKPWYKDAAIRSNAGFLLVSHLCPRVLCWAGEDSSYLFQGLTGPLFNPESSYFFHSCYSSRTFLHFQLHLSV